MGKGVARGFLDRASSGCWGLSSLQDDTKPNQNSVFVGDSVQRFE